MMLMILVMLSMMMVLLMLMLLMLRMGEVETYTSLAPVGALTQEYKGLLVVSKVSDHLIFEHEE